VIRVAARMGKAPCYFSRKHQPGLPKCAGFYSSASCYYLSSRAKVGVDGVYSKLFDGLVISIHLATGLSTRATRATRAPARVGTSPNGSWCVRKEKEMVCITRPAQLAAERRNPLISCRKTSFHQPHSKSLLMYQGVLNGLSGEASTQSLQRTHESRSFSFVRAVRTRLANGQSL
jgi:hypothetical protein